MSRSRLLDELGHLITYERKGRVAYLKLNRAEKLNAISDDVVEVLKARLEQFDHDDEAWVAILHGEGRAFSSGADVIQRQYRPAGEEGGPQPKRNVAAHVFYDSVNWKPIIAACHGYVFGAALGWMLNCDLSVASAGTKLQLTEVARGLGAARLWWLLAAQTDATFADEIALTARVFTAEEAHRRGLFTAIAEEGKHLEVAAQLADAVLENPPLSVRLIVRSRRLQQEEHDRRWTSFAKAHQLHLTEDYLESARAFVEKREPIYRGE